MIILYVGLSFILFIDAMLYLFDDLTLEFLGILFNLFSFSELEPIDLIKGT